MRRDEAGGQKTGECIENRFFINLKADLLSVQEERESSSVNLFLRSIQLNSNQVVHGSFIDRY